MSTIIALSNCSRFVEILRITNNLIETPIYLVRKCVRFPLARNFKRQLNTCTFYSFISLLSFVSSILIQMLFERLIPKQNNCRKRNKTCVLSHKGFRLQNARSIECKRAVLRNIGYNLLPHLKINEARNKGIVSLSESSTIRYWKVY